MTWLCICAQTCVCIFVCMNILQMIAILHKLEENYTYFQGKYIICIKSLALEEDFIIHYSEQFVLIGLSQQQYRQ